MHGNNTRNCLVESEDLEDEANLAAVKVRGPLTDIATQDVLVPQIPNKGSRAFITIEVKIWAHV